MIEQVCSYIHNFFVYGRESGTFTITNGAINVPMLVAGQYYRICGSRFNDGVHVYGDNDLRDETFEGVIWEMRPPLAFLDVVKDIEAWQSKYGDAVSGPYQSESFGGYSYSLANGTNANGTTSGPGWQTTFKARLNQWRKLA